jgi:transposase
MSAPLSKDPREGIIAGKEEGLSHARLVKELRVSASAITRVRALYLETGSVEARSREAGRKPGLDEQRLQKISARIKEAPDIGLKERTDEFSLPVGAAALRKTINHEPRLCREKTAHAAEQQRPGVARRRSGWKAKRSDFDTNRRVFLDESGGNTGLTRRQGRAAQPQRVIEAIPDTRFHRTTISSSIRQDGTTIPFVFEGALDGDLFRACVTHWLAPSPRPGDIGGMDKLSSPRVSGVMEAIESAGASVLFLPPCRPDLDPVELMGSKIKAIPRKLKVRAKELLDDAIAQAFHCIPLSDISGGFKHDGYGLL